MRRFALLFALVIASGACGSKAPPATTTGPEAQGVTTHQCALEGQGFDCAGCQTVPPAAPDDALASPTCTKTVDNAPQDCPRVCCNLCPSE